MNYSLSKTKNLLLVGRFHTTIHSSAKLYAFSRWLRFMTNSCSAKMEVCHFSDEKSDTDKNENDIKSKEGTTSSTDSVGYKDVVSENLSPSISSKRKFDDILPPRRKRHKSSSFSADKSYDFDNEFCTRTKRTFSLDDKHLKFSEYEIGCENEDFGLESLFTKFSGKSEFSEKSSKKPKSKKTKKAKPKKKDKDKGGASLKPNYFVGIRVTNHQVLSAVSRIQSAIVTQDPRLTNARIKPECLHLTLAVMFLSDDEQVQEAAAAMQSCKSELLSEISTSPIIMELRGISTFNNKVLYVNVGCSETVSRLQRMVDIIEREFTERGIHLTDKSGFKPHVTMFKTSKLYQKNKKNRMTRIQTCVWEDVATEDFGCQTVESVQLLSMMKPKDHTGYYQCSSEVKFDTPTGTVPLKFLNEARYKLSRQKDLIVRKFHSLTSATRPASGWSPVVTGTMLLGCAAAALFLFLKIRK